MKIKTDELIGAALDWAVAKCKGLTVVIPAFAEKPYVVIKYEGGGVVYSPSTDIKQGWDILQYEINAIDHIQTDRVCAIICARDMANGGYYHGYGPTILIAAMRCYVFSKLGKEVEVPDELIWGDIYEPVKMILGANARLIAAAPELLAALMSIEAAQKAEEHYRWEYIGSYPPVPIPDEVREKWNKDLSEITKRQYEARRTAQALIQKLTEV